MLQWLEIIVGRFRLSDYRRRLLRASIGLDGCRLTLQRFERLAVYVTQKPTTQDTFLSLLDICWRKLCRNSIRMQQREY